MNQPFSKTGPKMRSPARYKILVQGNLDERWSGRLGGLIVSTISNEEGGVRTQLVGELMDQAALHGVLSTLYELQLPIIAVFHINDDTS